MGVFLISYTLIALVVFFVIFVLMVSRGLIFKHNTKVQSVFAHPLLIYSLRRIGSALVSIMLAITATYLLLRLQSREDICSKLIPDYTKLPEAVKVIRCDAIMDELGLSGSAIEQLLKYYYKILPFPKTICSQVLSNPVTLPSGEVLVYMEVSDCRNFIMDLGKVYNLPGYTNQFVLDVIFKEKMPHSFKIGIIAVIVELGLGYPMGIMMAKHKDGWFDKLGNAYIISISAIPGVAYYFIWMSIFMALMLPITYDSKDFSTYIAPALTLGFTGMAGIALWVRRYMLDEFNSDYVKFARAKGLSENRIMFTRFKKRCCPISAFDSFRYFRCLVRYILH